MRIDPTMKGKNRGKKRRGEEERKVGNMGEEEGRRREEEGGSGRKSNQSVNPLRREDFFSQEIEE